MSVQQSQNLNLDLPDSKAHGIAYEWHPINMSDSSIVYHHLLKMDTLL